MISGKFRILVVDDERSMRDWISIFLKKEGYRVDTAENGESAEEIMNKVVYDLVISDVKMPGISGIDLLRQGMKVCPDTIFIMITAYSETEIAVEALKIGAADYVIKPFDLDEFKIIIENALEKRKLEKENVFLKQELFDNSRFENIIGKSAKIREVFSMVRRVVSTNSTVLVTGESGTGKELIARAIHFNSSNAQSPFISINCGAMPENLLESELFGHIKGSFTGAVTNKKGLFEEAENGTIFLDEISETSSTMQVKLLRVLQEKTIRRVGGNEEIKVNARVIAATNSNIEEMVANGEFREDLFYRINVIPIQIPPLRERTGDIVLLAEHFLNKFSSRMGKEIKSISEPAMDILCRYNWPGNVRELENVMERAVALEPSSVVLPERLPDKIRNYSPLSEKLKGTTDVKIPETGFNLQFHIENIECGYLKRALIQTGGNKKEAADMLGLSMRSLRYLIKKYCIEI